MFKWKHFILRQKQRCFVFFFITNQQNKYYNICHQFTVIADEANFSDFVIVFHIRRYRRLAQRSFVSWCWGYLSRTIRVAIPSCVVLRICREFPDSAGSCVEFRPPLDWTVIHALWWLPSWKVCHVGLRVFQDLDFVNLHVGKRV